MTYATGTVLYVRSQNSEHSSFFISVFGSMIWVKMTNLAIWNDCKILYPTQSNPCIPCMVRVCVVSVPGSVLVVRTRIEWLCYCIICLHHSVGARHHSCRFEVRVFVCCFLPIMWIRYHIMWYVWLVCHDVVSWRLKYKAIIYLFKPLMSYLSWMFAASQQAGCSHTINYKFY